MAGIAFAGIAQISRAESRAARGLEPIEHTEPPDVVDAELVPEPGKQGRPFRGLATTCPRPDSAF